MEPKNKRPRTTIYPWEQLSTLNKHFQVTQKEKKLFCCKMSYGMHQVLYKVEKK